MSDAFELDANIVNFVYYGKTRLKEGCRRFGETFCLFYFQTCERRTWRSNLLIPALFISRVLNFEDKFSLLSRGTILPSIRTYILLQLSFFANKTYIIVVDAVGSALTYDWSVNCFIIAVYKKTIFSRTLDRKF